MCRSLWTAAIVGVMAAVVRITGAAATPGRIPQAPGLLSQTGLLVAGTTRVDGRNRAYSPQYPLWTDGAVKARWMRLPDGAVIDARYDDDWRFPVGTKFWKEFSFGGRRVETRFIWRANEAAWVFASYVWNDDQTDAVRAPDAGVRGVIEVGPGKRHSIPSVDDCHACHEADRILGVNALQLSTDRDPLAPHAERFDPAMLTVKTLLDEQRLHLARPDLLTRPPRIDAQSPAARAALGYLATNCGICHDDGAQIDTRLRLRTLSSQPSHVLLDLLKTAPTSWDIPSAGIAATRFVTPGHPELSSIVARMQSRRPSTQMPPLGTVTVDEDALRVIKTWIEEMGDGATSPAAHQ